MSPEERFWSKVDKSADCWQWAASLEMHGYGQFKMAGTMKKAHRVSWEFVNGPIPTGMFLDHRCHNRSCVNPTHLRLVTPKGNIENHSGSAKANSKLGVRGVTWHKQKHCYVAQVRHNGKTYTQSFTTVAEAADYVVKLRNELHTFNDRDRAIA
jgi:hypothetical protein